MRNSDTSCEIPTRDRKDAPHKILIHSEPGLRRVVDASTIYFVESKGGDDGIFTVVLSQTLLPHRGLLDAEDTPQPLSVYASTHLTFTVGS